MHTGLLSSDHQSLQGKCEIQIFYVKYFILKYRQFHFKTKSPCTKHITVWSSKCILLGSVSLQQRFGVTDTKALGLSQLLGLGQTV